MSAGNELSSDHPGFNDIIYRKRRDEITLVSRSYKLEHGVNAPYLEYTETETWSKVWDMLIPLHKKYACKEFNQEFENCIKHMGFSRDKIPQIRDISAYLKKKTNWIFRPVAGLLTQREFLNGLAFRVFHSTQYIRHSSKPLYTPELDIIHEFLGHASMFCNSDFAQIIGMASLGASHEDIAKLGTLYWFTVEFGICMEDNHRKVIGGRILSSPSECEWAVNEGPDGPKIHKFEVEKMAVKEYTITDIQQEYFLVPSFIEMKDILLKYVENIKRPFNITYNIDKEEMVIDRSISMRENEIVSSEKLF